MPRVERISAMEILDSRGKPTLKATCELAGGVVASASVPSGASTGAAEAAELRDGGSRYGGQGCRRAAANVNEAIHQRTAGCDFADQAAFDRAILALDDSPNKARIGANAFLSASIAFARACALEANRPLYEHFAGILGQPIRTLPRLTINLFSGGKHAGGQVPIQDVLVVPASASSIDDGLAMTHAVYQAAIAIGREKYGMRPLTADEGGLAPPFASIDDMFGDAVAAIERAGLRPRSDVCLAIDVASSHFFDSGRYALGGQSLDSRQMIRVISDWVARYPIVSVEDGLAEDDWQYWPLLREAISPRAIVLGDDLLCTNPRRIERAIQAGAADALLLKVNQIGTLTEAAESCRIARAANWRVTVSARSGETEDDWLADLAVGWGGDQIKVGSITQSERLAKYNRLLEIERQTRLPVNPWPHGMS